MKSLTELNQLIKLHHTALAGFISCRISGDFSNAENIAQNVWIDVTVNWYKNPSEGGFDPIKGTFFNYVINRFAKFHIRRYRTARSQQPVLKSLRENSENALQSLIEAGSSESAEENLIRVSELDLVNKVFLELFRITFLCGGYPHQQLAFAFSRHIYGTKSPRGIEGKPGKLESEFADTDLETLTHLYLRHYQRASDLPDKYFQLLKTHLQPLVLRSDTTLKELLRYSSRLLKQLGEYSECKTGKTSISMYISSRGFKTSVSDWCDKLERRIKTVLGLKKKGNPEDLLKEEVQSKSSLNILPGSCSRCKLRHLNPCYIENFPRKGSENTVDHLESAQQEDSK